MMGEQLIIAVTIIAITLIAGMTLNGLADKFVEALRLRQAAKAGRPDLDAAAIEERLRVLERIATDRGALLADEIEALRRDVPAIGQQAEVTAP